MLNHVRSPLSCHSLPLLVFKFRPRSLCLQKVLGEEPFFPYPPFVPLSSLHTLQPRLCGHWAHFEARSRTAGTHTNSSLIFWTVLDSSDSVSRTASGGEWGRIETKTWILVSHRASRQGVTQTNASHRATQLCEDIGGARELSALQP